MSENEENEEEKEVHNHYHLWPSNCGCAIMVVAFVVYSTIEMLAKLDKLPW